MKEDLSASVKEICRRFGDDKTLLMDILRAVQAEFGSVSDAAIDAVADAVSIPRV